MRALVTGGAGFIGSHVVDRLVEKNFEVAVIDDLSTGSLDNLSDRAQFFQQDICDPEAAHTIKYFKPDIIVHTAAQMSVSDSMKDPLHDVRVNVQGTVNLLNALDREKFPFFVFLSTGGALYGEQDVFPAPEDHPLRPTSVYGQSKAVVEQYLALWQRVYGLKYAVLRLANVYGPRQNPHGEAGVVAIFLKKLLSGEIPTINGSGRFTRDYVNVLDVVSAIEKVVEQKIANTFNVGTGIETSVNELYQHILNSGNFITPANYGPQRAGDQERSVITSARAKELLDWSPKMDLAAGLTKTYEWFASQQS